MEAWEAAGGDAEGEYPAGVARSGVAGRGPQPLTPLDPAAAKEVDRRLWAGAAAEGWRVILRTYSSRDGRKIDASIFVGPSGSRIAIRALALAPSPNPNPNHNPSPNPNPLRQQDG